MLNVEERPAMLSAGKTPQPRAAAVAPAQPVVSAQSAAAVLPDVQLPERPALAADVQLVGEMQGTGFESQQWLVQRGEDFIQLSELLYRVIEQIDGERTIEEIAARAAEATGRPVSANNVRYLLLTRFIPLNLIEGAQTAGAVGAKPGAKKAKGRRGQQERGPLQLTLRFGFIGPRPIEFFSRFLQHLFTPVLLIPILLVAAVCQVYVFFVHGITGTIAAMLSHPVLLLPVSTFVFVSAIFHEFGHSSALRYGGGRARSMGFGLYFAMPAFYTDCTESYRLTRWARLRTDMGGIYFDLITTSLLTIAYLLTHQELLLAAVFMLDLEIADQFNPTMRFDGYWALADLVGVPDFFVLMGPVVRSMFPKRFRAEGRKAPPLKGWVKVVFLMYTVVTIPILYFFFASLLAFAPAFLAGNWNSLVEQYLDWTWYQTHHDLIGMGTVILQAGILLLSAFFLCYAVNNLIRSLVRGLWRMGHRSKRNRALALVLGVGVVGFFWLFWSPQVTAIADNVVRIVNAEQAANAPGGPRQAYNPHPTLLPTPGIAGQGARITPNQHVLPTPAPLPLPTATTAPQSGDPSAGGPGHGNGNGSQPGAKPDPGTHRAPGGNNTGQKGNPGGSNTKPKRTPPPGFPTPPPPPPPPFIPGVPSGH